MRFEHWWFTLPLRLKSIFRRERVELEMDEELRFHLDRMIEEGVAQGLSPDTARHRAMRAMGGIEQRKDEIRDARRVSWLTDFVDDVRFAFRSLGRTPGLALFVVVTLALGIGMTATPFSMIDALVFRPYPVPRPADVVTLVGTSHDRRYDFFSFREYQDLRNATRSYDGVVASTSAAPVAFAAGPADTPRVHAGMLVSGDYFRVLGVEPALGRGFRDDEDVVPGRDPVAVLAHDFWQRELAGDAGIVGRRILVNGAEVTVVGVAPESFPGMQVFTRPEIYLPLAMAPLFSTDPRKSFFEDRDDRELNVKARIRRGVSLAEARQEIASLAEGFERAYPATNRDRGAAVRTMLEMRTRSDDVNWKFGVIFNVLAVATLAVACTNVAGLLLARARARTREIAVRLAIGAGRSRLIRLLLTESLVLSILGGLGGVLVAWVGIELFQTFTIPAELPVQVPFRLDGRVLAACAVISVLAAVLCGLAPALQATRADLATGLKAADVDTPGRKRLWGRNALVVAQVAVSLMLLTASFLMARSFGRSVRQPTGFAKDNILMSRFDPRLVRYDAARAERFYADLLERVRSTPGVRSAGLTLDPPLGLGDLDTLAFVPSDFQMPAGRKSLTVTADAIDEGFFETMGIALVAGRNFAATDDSGSPPVAIVNRRFAERYWPGADPLGKRLELNDGGGSVEVVGVAATIKYRDTGEKPMEFVYLPLAQHPKTHLMLLVRTHDDPLAMLDPLKRIVRELDSNMPMLETRTFESLYRYSAVDGPAFAIRLVGTMGAVGLVLALVGLYGLVAYNVSRRTREIGIRMAIGAAPRNVLREMMAKGLVLVAIGTGIGLALGFAVEQAMNSALFHVGRVDVFAYLVVVPSMLLVTVLAAYVPARRASRLAPTLALRYE